MGKTGREIGRRWTGADEAHAFSFRRRAISWRGDGYQASNLFQETCVLSRSAGQACGRRESVHVLCLTSTMLFLDHRALLQGSFQQSASWFNSLHLHSYHGSVHDARFWHLLGFRMLLTPRSQKPLVGLNSAPDKNFSLRDATSWGHSLQVPLMSPCRDPHRILPSFLLVLKPFPSQLLLYNWLKPFQRSALDLRHCFSPARIPEAGSHTETLPLYLHLFKATWKESMREKRYNSTIQYIILPLQPLGEGVTPLTMWGM